MFSVIIPDQLRPVETQTAEQAFRLARLLSGKVFRELGSGISVEITCEACHRGGSICRTCREGTP